MVPAYRSLPLALCHPAAFFPTSTGGFAEFSRGPRAAPLFLPFRTSVSNSGCAKARSRRARLGGGTQDRLIVRIVALGRAFLKVLTVYPRDLQIQIPTRRSKATAAFSIKVWRRLSIA